MGEPARGIRWRPPPAKEAQAAPRELEPVVVVYADLLEAHGDTRVVALTAAEYQRAVQQLGHRFQVKGSAQETAQALLQAMPEEELLAEVYRDRVLTLVPLNDKGPLVPEAEAALKILSSLVWAAGLYLALWLLPEPSTKAVAASLSVVLDAMWGLLDGWVTMAQRAHEATTFEEVREAGEAFGRVIGTDAARALILAVATLSGRTLGEVAAHVRSLPKFNQVQAQWAAQGMEGSVAVAMEEVAAVEVVVEESRALVVLTSPQAPVAINVLAKSGAGGAAGGHSGTVAIQHRGGNKQVVLGNGERWHLPRGKSLNDIPAEDPLGDELQVAVKEVASKWSEAALTDAEREAISEMRRLGKGHWANLLERQARGRWVEARVKRMFPDLAWNGRGVDIAGPIGQSYHYEILSGTDSNFALHGRRMASTFFRMIFF
jgi:hypothetical protein